MAHINLRWQGVYRIGKQVGTCYDRRRSCERGGRLMMLDKSLCARVTGAVAVRRQLSLFALASVVPPTGFEPVSPP